MTATLTPSATLAEGAQHRLTVHKEVAGSTG
jgi:hypothetical protein